MQEILKVLIADPDRTNALAAVASAIVALSALLIAVISIIVSWKTLSTQRTHNKLSVRPIPYFMLGDFDNKIIVSIRNNGSGPLIISNVDVSDGTDSKSDVVSWMPPQPKLILFRHFSKFLENRSIMAGGELVLLELSGDPDREIFASFRDECRYTLSKLKIQMNYADIYGDVFPIAERNMDWFARTLPQPDVDIKKQEQ